MSRYLRHCIILITAHSAVICGPASTPIANAAMPLLYSSGCSGPCTGACHHSAAPSADDKTAKSRRCQPSRKRDRKRFPASSCNNYLQALAGQIDIQPGSCLLSQPWQPAGDVAVRHVADSKGLEDDAAHTAGDEVTVRNPWIAAWHDRDPNDVWVQLHTPSLSGTHECGCSWVKRTGSACSRASKTAAHLKPRPVDAGDGQQRGLIPVNIHAEIGQVRIRGRVKRLVEAAVRLLAPVAAHQAAAEADRDFV